MAQRNPYGRPGFAGQRSGQFNRPVVKKKPKPVAPVAGGKRRKGGGGLSALLNPAALLSGKKLGKGAGALTRIELNPAINAYGRQVGDLQAQQTGASQGLQGLGDRTAGAVGGVYDTLAGSSAQTLARQQVLQNMLNQQTQNVNTQTQQNLTNAQTGELGGLTEALTSRNVPPGGSASQQALAQQVQAQQQAAAQRAQGYGQFAASVGASQTGLASAEAQAEQNRGREAQASIHQAIADRIAQSNSDYGSSIREAQGKQADTKALWGSTKLKNLLQLRGSERDFLNAQASLQGQNWRAKLSAQTSTGNNKRTTSTSSANNQRTTANSRKNAITGAKTSKRNSIRSQQQSNTNSIRSSKGKKKK